jgi:serine/threonine protein kinase/tetratricopeptide (TPR) repeat protein
MVNHDPAGSDPTLDRPASPAAAETVAGSLREGPGTRIGPYKLLQLIGEGGFGSVFMAEQEKPVSRKVALKIIKLGMDTRQVVARFEQERQALAILDHPHIAKVFDGGATETGRPYFVMELCTGEPIDAYCDRNNSSIRDRLELFAQVCAAVQHAHTKGLIHRDLKPSNILVSTQDSRAHAKVIDFGIAKATASRLTEKTVFTEQRQMIGTPEYMSPEQAEGSLDIDTRTDVYSLGVLLYELLTGSTPFSSHELRSAAYAEIQRIIREVEPPKPSTRISHNTDTIASVAACRHCEPRRLGAIIRGDLDWIVMKALEKDRTRRYETANGLAMDVGRYLAGEAVLAAPPSTVYRFRKFVRRNKGPVAAGLVVSAVLVLGLAGTSVGMARAIQEKTRAEQSAAESQALARVVTDDLAGAVDPWRDGANVGLADALVAAADRAGERLIASPGLRASVEHALSESLLTLARYKPAERLAQSAYDGRVSTLGVAAPETLASRFLLAQAVLGGGDNERAIGLLRSLREVYAARGEADTERALEILSHEADALGNLGRTEEALNIEQSVFDRSLALLGAMAGATQRAGCRLAGRLVEAGRGNDALALLEPHAAAILEQSATPDDARVLLSLAEAYRAIGRTQPAEDAAMRSLSIRQRLWGDEHPHTVAAMVIVADAMIARNRSKEAEPFRRRVYEVRRDRLGREHAATLNAASELASTLGNLERYEEAEPLLFDTLIAKRRLLGENHPDVASTLEAIGILRSRQGRSEDAIAQFTEAIRVLRASQTADTNLEMNVLSNLAVALSSAGRLQEAEVMLRDLVKIESKQLGPEASYTLNDTRHLAKTLISLHRPAEAVDLMSAVVAARLRAAPDDHISCGLDGTALGHALLDAGRLTDAEAVLLKAHERLDPQRRATGYKADAAALIVRVYDTLHKERPHDGYDVKAASWRAKTATTDTTKDSSVK